MRESIRSRLRAVLLIWAAACLTVTVGYCAALAIFVFGIYEGVEAFSSSNPTLAGVGPMVLGCCSQLLLAFLFLGIRDRFENRCWQLVAAEAGALVGEPANTQVLSRQAAGEDNFAGNVRMRQSERLSKRLRALIEEAWPDRSAR